MGIRQVFLAVLVAPLAVAAAETPPSFGTGVSFSSSQISFAAGRADLTGSVVVRISAPDNVGFKADSVINEVAGGEFKCHGHVHVTFRAGELVADDVTIRPASDAATGYTEITANKAAIFTKESQPSAVPALLKPAT